MTVEEVFTITNRGTAVIGEFQGAGRAGDRAFVQVDGARTVVDHVTFEMLDYLDKAGRRSARLAILLRGETLEAMPVGAVIESAD